VVYYSVVLQCAAPPIAQAQHMAEVEDKRPSRPAAFKLRPPLPARNTSADECAAKRDLAASKSAAYGAE